jgi:YjbR
MTADDFRRIALGMEGAIESTHMGHPDFRANGKIFATIHHDHKWGMVKLTPDQQQEFLRENREAFIPENGAWGRAGCTKVRLDLADQEAVGLAMTVAWQNTAKRKATAVKTKRLGQKGTRRRMRPND